MEYNLSQTFEDSRKAVDDYLKYILCQSSEQREKADYSLNSLMDSVNAVGTVAAMAAKESMVSHNSTF